MLEISAIIEGFSVVVFKLDRVQPNPDIVFSETIGYFRECRELDHAAEVQTQKGKAFVEAIGGMDEIASETFYDAVQASDLRWSEIRVGYFKDGLDMATGECVKDLMSEGFEKYSKDINGYFTHAHNPA